MAAASSANSAVSRSSRTLVTCGSGIRAVAGGVDVPAPGEHQPVQPPERVLDARHRRQ